MSGAHASLPWSGQVDGVFPPTSFSVDHDEAATTCCAPIVDATGKTIALVVTDQWDESEMEANAELIVRAVNEYQPMLDQLAAAGAKVRSLEVELSNLREAGKRVIASEMARTKDTIALRDLRDDLVKALIDVRDNVGADTPEMWARVDAAIAKAEATWPAA